MQITVLGAVLVPLSLLWASQPIRLLQVALVAAIFEAAAALIFGGFGLQPAIVPGLLFMAYVALQYALGMRYRGEAAVLRTLAPLLALLAYAVLSVWLLPDAFAGRVMVWPQKVDLLTSGFVPLAFSFGNVTQTLYLGVDIAFTLAVALFMTRAAVPYERIIAAHLAGGYVVVALSFWQFANRVAGVWFPYDILQSNPGWVIVQQSLGAVPRIQGPFSEPAALAFYLSGLTFCCLWLVVRGYRTLRPVLLLGLAMFSMMLSTSTTGMATLAVGLPLVLVFASAGGDRRGIGRIGRLSGLLVLASVLTIGPAFVLRPDLADSVATVVDATISKQDSESYDQRTEIDAAAVATVAETYGLGVGWGSFRSSSLVPGLLANAGVFGVAMVGALGMGVVALGRRARRIAPSHPGRILVDGFSAALCGQLVAALLSAPMITSLVFYLQLGCVVGVLGRMSTDAAAERATVPFDVRRRDSRWSGTVGGSI